MSGTMYTLYLLRIFVALASLPYWVASHHAV
jgi:hypothetical protein